MVQYSFVVWKRWLEKMARMIEKIGPNPSLVSMEYPMLKQEKELTFKKRKHIFLRYALFVVDLLSSIQSIYLRDVFLVVYISFL